ncbi:NAD(P)H-dependent glycerol-3-phosphate dehydrogenase [Inquilinus sp. NPDC058860]|uniref:NAD(P)H-dependent glycerol-3-phosphate dehydrogenase n=1 Tax=Inquilinus sp. NPDC058860 TaxID=3346652 RepID=UPI00367CF732
MTRGRIAVIGAGAWGTALAQSFAGAGHKVVLWARDPDRAAAMRDSRENAAYLPGIALHPGIAVTADLMAAEGLRVLAVPAQHLRAILERLPPRAGPLVITAKGIETATGLFMDQVTAEARPEAAPALLSGPSFAAEVARGLPTALTLACADAGAGAALARSLGHGTLRLYWSEDLRGVALGGALKNVLAIAAGIVTGRGLGENARAALVTRGLAEMARLGAGLGARPETLTGLSGLGDLLLTACSATSRNTSLGIALGQGRTLTEILGERRSVTEGVWTAAAAARLAAQSGVDAPVIAAVDAVLNRGAAIDTTVAGLLLRPAKREA